jgi:hypothetical protein
MSTSDARQRVMNFIHGRPQAALPIWLINPMEWSAIDHLAGQPPGSYQAAPERVYHLMLQRVGCCMVDQWIPRNPLSMGVRGFEGERPRTATTGADSVVVDGMAIHEPEDVAAHLEKVVLPRLAATLATYDPAPAVAEFLRHEAQVQAILGPSMVKVPYGCFRFPGFAYGTYGYGPYFMAFALYPDLMEKHFQLQADLAVRHNQAMAQALMAAGVPPLVRLDHDMADSRGTLVRVTQLDELWLPHFTRAIAPALAAGFKLIWHCDGNLMAMVPRLLAAGLHGFQGFQYEDGMDYEAICRLRTRDGDPLLIIGGVSVTTTLPFGTPAAVRQQIDWLVAHGPRYRLMLGGSSSITPGVPLANLDALAAGFRHYAGLPMSPKSD